MSDDPAGITFSPNPPTAGGRMTISYTANTTIMLDWTPAGTPTSGVTDANGNLSIVVPANATSLIMSAAGAQPVATSIT